MSLDAMHWGHSTWRWVVAVSEHQHEPVPVTIRQTKMRDAWQTPLRSFATGYSSLRLHPRRDYKSRKIVMSWDGNRGNEGQLGERKNSYDRGWTTTLTDFTNLIGATKAARFGLRKQMKCTIRFNFNVFLRCNRLDLLWKWPLRFMRNSWTRHSPSDWTLIDSCR